MDNFFAELKRRHIYRVAAAYAVVAWVLLQLVNNLAPGLNLPNWALTFVIVLLAVGFPISLVFAWILELKTPADGATARAATGKLDWFLAAALVVVIALVSYQQLAPTTGARTSQQAGVATGAPNPTAISIAVLPLANLSGDTAQEFFSDGMTDEITSALAKVRDLRVVGRSSAFQFKGQNKDLRAIGHALSARYLIDGSVRKAGDRVRISAQLVEADNGVQLWSENYDRQLTDIFATQEDIAQAIAGALRVPLGLKLGVSLVPSRTANLESYQDYLRARALVRARGQREPGGPLTDRGNQTARTGGRARSGICPRLGVVGAGLRPDCC
jgi:TolB-like protein